MRLCTVENQTVRGYTEKFSVPERIGQRTMRSKDEEAIISVFHKMGVIIIHWFSGSHKWETFGCLPVANLVERMD